MSQYNTTSHNASTRRSTLPPGSPVTLEQLTTGLRRLDEVDRPRCRRVWTYYRNPLQLIAPVSPEVSASERPYRQGQEWGLPARITGYEPAWVDGRPRKLADISRKEVVIENDIAWRVDAMVDYLFGKPITLTSLASDPTRAGALASLVSAVLEANGGASFLQQLALLGAVYGFVDVVVKLDVSAALSLHDEVGAGAWDALVRQMEHKSRAAPGAASAQATMGAEAAPSTAEATPSAAEASASATGEVTPGSAGAATAGPGGEGTADHAGQGAVDDSRTEYTGTGSHPDGQLIERLARLVRFEIVHPSCAVPLLRDSQQLLAYAQVFDSIVAPSTETRADREARRRWWQWGGWSGVVRRTDTEADQRSNRIVELLTPTRWYRLSGGEILASGDISIGALPVVHIQNIAVPFDYGGKSDVEPLIPLQDELNTRLSDRAYRITMTSFKMFLGKGLDNFLTAPIGPGRMWSTDNTDAEIDEFGGDDRCPSEEQHISDLRDALDKASSVPPVAAGAIKDRLGQLSSAAALRVTLASLMAKTERKRATYGRGIQQLCELALAWLDSAGLVPTVETERKFEINWPGIIPDSTTDKLQEASLKVNLGVPRDIVLQELGY
jgi:hypothetical protein